MLKRYLQQIGILCCVIFIVPSVKAQLKTKTAFFKADIPEIRYVGRVMKEKGQVAFDWSGTYFTTRFSGNYCAVRLSDTRKNYYNVFIDGKFVRKIKTEGKDTLIVLAEKLKGKIHDLRLQKRTEAEQGRTIVHGFELAAGEHFERPEVRPSRHIEFIGNSITCGYGTEAERADDPFTPETENCNEAYGCIIARYFNADYTLIAHSGRGAVRNYGDTDRVSPNTMRKRMLNTFDEDSLVRWNFSDYRPDLVVVNLGSNDFSTMPHPLQYEFCRAYAEIIENIRKYYGEVPVLCVAPRVGEPAFSYIHDFCRTYPDENIHFAALMKGIYNADTDLGASAHPNYRGQQKIAMALIPYISSVMGWELTNEPVR